MFLKRKRRSIELQQVFFMLMSVAFQMANTKTAPEEHAMPETPEIAACTVCALHDRGIRVNCVSRSEIDPLNG